MGDKAEFKLAVNVHELLDFVVVVAEGKHLVDKKLERQVARRLLEVRFDGILPQAFFADLLALDIDALD